MTLDPKIAQRFKNYQILSPLGQGGMSSVYLAKNIDSEEKVAIKFLHPYLAHQESCRQRFFTEAYTVARLQHKHIVKVLEYSQEDEKELFIVTEFIPGKTLQEFAQQHQLHTCPELAAMMIARIAQTLAYAHEQGIIHRDIKPENIMVRDDGVLKLMDFGIARVTDRASITLTGTLLGSPAYMPPELIEGKEISQKSDVFSLAAVFYWLATAKTPFAGDSPHALLRSISDGLYIPPSEQSPRILPSLAHVIDLGLAHNVEDRCASALALADAIICALKEFGIDEYVQELESMLLNPAHSMQTLNALVHKRCIKDARLAIRNDRVMQAMALLNRVLAVNVDDAEAQSLLASLSQTRIQSNRLLKHVLTTSTAMLPLLMIPGQLTQRDIVYNKALEEELCKYYQEPIVEDLPQIAPSETIDEFPLKITIAPYADVYVDEKLVKKNVQEATLQLAPGRHRLVFKHAYAQTVDKVVEIGANKHLQELRIKLEKVKPATLVVKTPFDADIAVNGVYKGTTNHSVNHPIIISLPNKKPQMKYEVIVSKKGFKPYVESHNFIAGVTKEIEVNLDPVG